MKNKLKRIPFFLFFIALQFCKTNCLAQQNSLDDKNVFLFYVKVNHYENDEDLFSKYLRIFKTSEYNLYRNDEFNYSKFYKSQKNEYLNTLNEMNFTTKFIKKREAELGAYDFQKESFPLGTSHWGLFGELYEMNPLPWNLTIIGASVFNSSYIDLELKLNEEKANNFIQKRKSSNGSINRKVTLQTEYSIMNKNNAPDVEFGMHQMVFLVVYIHKISIYDGLTLLETITPNEDYYDKVNGSKIKDGILKIFYNDKWNELLNSDGSGASYYRIINYKNGKVINPVIDYFISGEKQMVGNYSDYIDPRNGLFTWFYKNGQKSSEATYINGKLNGKYTEWYSNGEKKEEVNYVDNRKDGCDYVWDEAGKPLINSDLGGWTYPNSWSCNFDYYEDGRKSVYSNKLCPCAKRAEQNATEKNINTDVPKTASDVKTDYIDHYNDELPTGNYKIFDNSVYYKSNGLEIVSVSVEDRNGNIIRNAKSKVGYPIYLKLTISGLTSNGSTTKFTLSKYEEDINGTLVSTQSVKQDGNTNPTISITGGVRVLPNNNENSMKVHMSFSIKDRNSESIMHGFFTYTAER